MPANTMKPSAPSWGRVFLRFTGPGDSPGPRRSPCSSCWCRMFRPCLQGYASFFCTWRSWGCYWYSVYVILFNPCCHYPCWHPCCCPCGANEVWRSNPQPLRREKHSLWRKWGHLLLPQAALVKEEVTELVAMARVGCLQSPQKG